MSPAGGWGRGYPTATAYPAQWHGFQAPPHLAAVCAVAGVAWEVGPESRLRIAEIGCGPGYTANVLAAGNPLWEVVGLDYNPAEIAEARSMAAAAGLANATFIEADLAELDGTALGALGEFDLVNVHGLWSWVGDAVREGVLRLLRRCLKPGGLCLLSYNALPGSQEAVGLARLVRGATLAAGGGTAGIAAARDLTRRVLAAGARFLPPSGLREVLLGTEPLWNADGYLLHEFLTEHWRPSFFGDVAAAMTSARCDFAGSATLDENFPGLTLSADQQAIVGAERDPAMRELLLDLFVRRAFRRDLYVRGARAVPRDAAASAVLLGLAGPAEGEVKLRAQAGEAVLPARIMDTLRAALAERPRTVAELRALPGCGGLTPEELLSWLVVPGCAVPLWRRPGEGPGWAEAVARARRFNAVAAARLVPFGLGPPHLALAGPALGGGLTAQGIELAAVAALNALEAPVPEGRAALLAALMARISPPPEIAGRVEARLATLLAERLPVWRQLGLA